MFFKIKRKQLSLTELGRYLRCEGLVCWSKKQVEVKASQRSSDKGKKNQRCQPINNILRHRARGRY